MHYPTTLSVALTLFISAPSVLAQAIRPYKDGQCTQPVTDYKLNNHSEPGSIWDNINGWPGVSTYSTPSFPGAEAKTGGGYTVYWKIGDPGLGCRVAIMAPYSQGQYGSLAFEAPPGNVILMVTKAGCYYSSIPQGADISSTFCCGVGDCTPLAVGNSALLKRDDASVSLFERESATTGDSIIPRQSTSLTGKAAEYAALQARDGLDFSTCKVIVTGGPYPEAGQQVLVANPQRCDSPPCTFAITHGVTVSTSLSVSKSTTITNTGGASIGFEAGVNFFVVEKIVGSVSYSYSRAVAKATDTTLTNATTISVTNTIGQQQGTYAFVTFTPTYLCWTSTADCGRGPSGVFHFCQPQMGTDMNLLQGDYTVVYTG